MAAQTLTDRFRRISPMRVAAWLLVAVLATASLVVGTTLSRYATQDESSDAARVAKFEVTQSGTLTATLPSSSSIAPGEVVTFDVQVANKSEVAIEYWITASNATNNLPLVFKMQKETAQGQWMTVESDSIDPGDSTAHSYKLIISWPKTPSPAADSAASSGNKDTSTAAEGDNSGADTTPSSMPDNQDPSYAGKTDAVNITLTAVQID